MVSTSHKTSEPVSGNCIDQIGTTAGQVWHALNEAGGNGAGGPARPISIAQLTKRINAPRDVIMQAIGWLAREGKIEVTQKGRSRTIGLKA